LLARGHQGAVYLVAGPTGPLIVKKAVGPGIVRALRRAMLRREHSIYKLLDDVVGVPRCHGLREGDELILGFIDGCSLRQAKQSPAEREQFFTELLQLIQNIHRAGVAHGDLKRKDNILVGNDRHPYVIDFGTAISAPEGSGFLRRFVFRQLRRMDLNAWVKLKYQRQWSDLAPEDRQYWDPTWLERMLRPLRRAWRAVTLRRLRRASRSDRS
jgi:predicted Ser/Thr protein kinase